MNENNYEEYKYKKIRDDKKRNRFIQGYYNVIGGILLLLLCMYLVPFHSENVKEISGNDLKTRNAYYIDDLQLLHVKTDDEDNIISCIAKFQDKDNKEWLISFTPGKNKQLINQIKVIIKCEKTLTPSYAYNLDINTNGYFYVEDIPSKADSYYSVYSKNYTDNSNITKLKLNADYLCGLNENYTLKALMRPGYTIASFAVGLFGVLRGIILLIVYRKYK